MVYPHRRLFEACVGVFKKSGRVVPVFIDNPLADTQGFAMDLRYGQGTEGPADGRLHLRFACWIPMRTLSKGPS